MKCSNCGEKADYTFLKKPKGTFINAKSGKKFVCSSCQAAEGEKNENVKRTKKRNKETS